MTISPQDLTADERAIVDAVVLKSFPTFAPDWSYPLAIVACEHILLARRALFTPQAQAQCDCKPCKGCKGERTVCAKCGRCTRCDDHDPGCTGCGGEPAPVAAGEMVRMPYHLTTSERDFPLPVALALACLRHEAEGYAVHDDAEPAEILNRAYSDLESWWRSQTAQPVAAVRMTPELERVLAAAKMHAYFLNGIPERSNIERDIAAVRRQFA